METVLSIQYAPCFLLYPDRTDHLCQRISGPPPLPAGLFVGSDPVNRIIKWAVCAAHFEIDGSIYQLSVFYYSNNYIEITPPPGGL